MSSLNQRILSKDEAATRVVEFTPKDFPVRPSEAVLDFVRFQTETENNDFKIDRIVSQTTGIAEIEKVALSERVESEALERLKVLQEEAYRQGYDLGRDEGQETAYREMSDAISNRLRDIENVILSFETLKTELVRQNESSLMLLVYQIASKIAMTEISTKPDVILPVLKQAAQDAQDEEALTIRLAPKDLDFIDGMKERLGQEFAFLKRAKLEANDSIQPGGCMIVTNYGQVDATLNTRLEKIWATIEKLQPKQVDVLKTDSGEGNE